MITEDKWLHYIVGVCPGELGQPVAVAVAAQRITLGHRRATGTVSGLGVQAAMTTGGFRSLAAWKRCPKPVPSVPL